jgi:acetyl-CoA carboxylase carboxyl transferase subunit alpha
MLENTWYSVISPESLSFYGKVGSTGTSCEALKLTSSDMKQNLIDDIIPEPLEEHITIERPTSKQFSNIS